jgi:hypothetical protein
VNFPIGHFDADNGASSAGTRNLISLDVCVRCILAPVCMPSSGLATEALLGGTEKVFLFLAFSIRPFSVCIVAPAETENRVSCITFVGKDGHND